MKPVVLRLYALLVVLALVGLVAWSGADWYQRQQQAQAAAQKALRQAAGTVSDWTVHNLVLDKDSLNRIFVLAFGSDVRWKMVLLSSPDRGTEYYNGPRPAVSAEQAVPRWEPRSTTQVKVSLPVFRAQGAPLLLEGIYEFYGRTEIFSLLKACGVTLIGLLVLTTLLVMLASRTRALKEPEPEAQAAPPREPSYTSTSPDASAEKEEYWFDDSPGLDDLPPMNSNSAHGPKTEPAPAPAPSLFSPSGLGWESFLTTRLDQELQRCASQNQDLALVVLALKTGSPQPEAWGRAVREAFPSVDLNFEHEGGAAILLPGKSLEEALKSARRFVEAAGPLGTVHAGVAARTGRLLSAQTLLGEADSAKRRSLAGSVRVLGLKTDPDRYREHLAAASV